jgi:uncharacterized protein YggE
MSQRQKYIPIIAICLSIIARFPTGIPPSMGTVASTWLGEEQVNAIHVSGSGSISATANQATVSLGVMTEDPSANEAVDDNAVLMTAVINAIKALGIPEDKIKTVTYSVYPNYDWELRQTTGYRVTNMIQIEIDDLDLVGDVIDAAANAGANNIQGISFGLSDDIAQQLQNDAYVLALQNARDKADLIADTLDIEVTGVLYVSESSYTPYIQTRSYDVAEEGMSAPTPILEGSLSVSVNVQVSFTFQ